MAKQKIIFCLGNKRDLGRINIYGRCPVSIYQGECSHTLHSAARQAIEQLMAESVYQDFFQIPTEWRLFPIYIYRINDSEENIGYVRYSEPQGTRNHLYL